MYAQHFNFSDLPFSIAPNPRYVYLSPQHREALAHLLYGISMGGGFVALTGEVGTGKTTLCRCLLDQLPEDVEIAVIFNPRLNSRELLASICDELRIPHPQHRASLKQLIDLLTHHLLDVHSRGKRTVLLIDEAQNLSFDVLEQIRLLTNLETNDTKLLQIILVGQPELNDLLRRRNLRQLSQRITARYHLRPLSFRETAAYIGHRIGVSGGKASVFGTMAVIAVYRLSAGIPRVINLICDRALLGAYALGKTEAGYAIVRKAAAEVLPSAEKRHYFGVRTSIKIVAVLFFMTVAYFKGLPDSEVDAISGKLAAVLVKLEKGDNRQQSSVVRQNAKAKQPQPAGVIKAKNIPKPAPPVPIAVEPSFVQLAAKSGLTRRAAFVYLLGLWRITAPLDDADECAWAAKNGLRCLFQTGSWIELRNLDAPAVLEFEFDDGSKRYATLAEMHGEKVRLFLGEQIYDFKLGDILPFWRGDALLLWKSPIGNVAAIKLGSRGEAVKWLRQRLGAAAPANLEDYFDKRLQAQVAAFQKQHGLNPDGIVGMQTLMLLTKKTEDSAIPRLVATTPTNPK